MLQSKMSYTYTGPLPAVGAYTNGVPNRLVWQDQVNIPLQVRRPTIPDGTINDATERGPFRREYNPYFFDYYKNRNIY